MLVSLMQGTTIEFSQQKVEPAALMRDSGNSNQHENAVEAPDCFQHSQANLFNLYPASLAILRFKTEDCHFYTAALL